MPSVLLSAADSPPSAASISYAANLCSAGYFGGLDQVIQFADSPPYQFSMPPFPQSWKWTESGTRVVLINGTTRLVDEGGSQWAGWQVPSPVPGGQANAWYRTASAMLASQLTDGADVVVGHSMGGAIAIELCQTLRQSVSPSCIAIALAPPRSRSASAADGIGLWATSVSYNHDPIPYLPGSTPLGIDWRNGGRVFTFDDTGKLANASCDYSDIVSTAALQSRWLPTGAHDIATYVGRLGSAAAAATNSVGYHGGSFVIDP